MHIIVCIKSVVAQAPEDKIVRTAQTMAFNPFDRPALEMALHLMEQHGGSVTALSMGPECAASALYEALAAGAQRAVLLCDPGLAGSDTLATSTALAAGIRSLEPFDLLLFGTRTSDSDTGQVGPQTAVLLGLPFVGWATEIKNENEKLIVSRRADGFKETFETARPAAFTVHPSAIKPRDLPLSGIETAFSRGRVEVWSLRDIGLSAQSVGQAGSGTVVRSMHKISRDRKCEFIPGSAEEQAEALVKRLLDAGLISD